MIETSGASRSQQARLLSDELRAQQQAFDNVLNTPAARLREQHQFFLARFHGVNEAQGNLILWLSDFALPRRQSLLTAFITPDQRQLNPASWSALSYRQLRDNANYPTELTLITTWKPQPDAQGRPGYLLLFRGATPELIDFLQRNPRALLCLGPPEPPLQYLANLRELVLELPAEGAAGRLLDLPLSASQWQPSALPQSPDLYLTVASTLAMHDEVIVQGPPGTGKTHLMATLAAQFVAQGKSVLVTALTNRALFELAEKEPLDAARSEHRVYKSNLAEDERRAAPGLLSAQDYEVRPGTLLLTTYFLMSSRALKRSNEPAFDVIIVEEASQAFLPTLAAARSLGQQMLVVGDPAQLPPILSTEISPGQPELAAVRDGLLTVCNHGNIPGLLLTDTFRLTPRATRFTNTFYGNQLRSCSPLPLPLPAPVGLEQWFSPKGGPTLAVATMPNGQVRVSAEIKSRLRRIIQALLAQQPSLQIAILSYYVEAVTDLQTAFHDIVDGRNQSILIETVSRVQGLTVDVCFFIIPHDRIARPLNRHVFNVATSRARRHTIIICDPELLSYRSINASVQEYLKTLQAEQVVKI